MSHTIHKYPLPLMASFEIGSRPGAEPLTVQMQDGRPCLWMRVPVVVRGDYQVHRFYWVGTGQECPFPSTYVGTVQLDGYVWHLFHA